MSSFAPSIYLSGRDSSKTLVRIPSLPSNDEDYGPVDFFDLAPPGTVFTIEALLISQAAVDEYYTLLETRSASITITEDSGKSWSGLLVGVSDNRKRGTVYCERVQFRIQKPA